MSGPGKSPLQAWQERLQLHELVLPGSIDELEIICCETDLKPIWNIGIELCHCTFNNTPLQELRRALPSGDQSSVQVKFNRSQPLHHVWVLDPRDGSRLQVINTCPIRRKLNEQQNKLLTHTQQDAHAATGQTISTSEAYESMQQLAHPFVASQTQAQRRRALKVMGMTGREEVVLPKRRRCKRKPCPATTASESPTAQPSIDPQPDERPFSAQPAPVAGSPAGPAMPPPAETGDDNVPIFECITTTRIAGEGVHHET